MAEPEAKSHLREGTIEEILKMYFSGTPKTRISKEASKLMTEVSTAFISELLERAKSQATLEGSESLTLEHVEKILPQIVIFLIRNPGVD